MQIKSFIPQKIKNLYHFGQAVLANFIYHFPSRKIKVIGITGTNGKTTVCQMTANILEEAGYRVAMASTISFKIAQKEWVNKTKFTTLSSFAVQKFIKNAVEAGCEYLVLETSSHALDQNRVWGIKYDVAVMTNVTREHLDYHKTMEDYRLAKYKLFINTSVIVINLDMIKPKDYLVYKSRKKYGYTLKEENFCDKYDCGDITMIKADDVELGLDYSSFKVNGAAFRINLLGEFNMENALASVCVGISQNIPLEKINRALERIKGVPGRMERVHNDKGIEIIIDYAVTPDSLLKLYKLIQRINTKTAKVIAVFGSCGDRDRGKRPIMGEIVSKYADYVIVTNEDPYGENPVQIINEVFSGVTGQEAKGNLPNFQFSNINPVKEESIYNDRITDDKKRVEGKNCWRILDRRKAINFALKLAKPEDMVVITGKGAEEVMAIGKKRIPWNDKKVVLEELSGL